MLDALLNVIGYKHTSQYFCGFACYKKRYLRSKPRYEHVSLTIWAVPILVFIATEMDNTPFKIYVI